MSISKRAYALGTVALGLSVASLSSAHAAFTGSIENTLNVTSKAAADEANWQILLGLANLTYSMIMYAVGFVTQPAVLGIAAVLMVLGFIATKGYKKVISKITGGGSRRRRK